LARNKKAKNPGSLMWVLYALLVALIALYIFHNSVVIGIGVIVLIIIILVLEFSLSVHSDGAKSSIIDLGVAILAVVIIFAVLMVILQTSSPIDVVTSCSMLPVLSRGEMLLLHGIPNMSLFLASHHVPIVNVSQSQFNGMIGNMSSEFLAFYAYNPSNKSDIADITNLGAQLPVGLYNSACVDRYSAENEPYNYYRCYVPPQAQANNLIKYNYSIGKMLMNGTYYSVVYTSSITIANTTIVENYSNPIVVYRTNSSDTFSGDIIHRAVAAIHVGAKYYILTKGDNNPGLDIQFANYPPSQSDIVGYFLGGLPYIGYLKLIVSGQLASDPQCGQVIQH
jgi:hypothetical protein